jgi:NAD+ synthase
MSDATSRTAGPEWAFTAEAAAERCLTFIRHTVAEAGRPRLVVGLSGGIDSAVAAALAVRALDAAAVRGLLLPHATSAADSLADAAAVADHLGITTETVEITSMVEAFLTDQPDADPLRRGNVMARCRMIVLYDRSARDGALVLGTGNRSEDLLGYTTLHGDNACGLNPLGQLYKTEIRLLARWLGLPEVVLTKAPSADLWQGQSDEDELGFSYAEADEVLHALIDQGLGAEKVAALGHAPELVGRIADRVAAMAFKRLQPPMAVFPGRRDPDRTKAVSASDGGFH